MRLHLFHAMEGAFGGLVGTALMMQGLGAAKRLPEPFQPPATSEDPGERMARRAEEMLGRVLPKPAHDVLAKGLHWAYGTSWGTLLGLAVPFLRTWPQALAAGAGMGAAAWTAGYVGWLPATGLTPPVHRQGGGHVLTSLLSHIAYGVAAAIPMYLLQRRMEPRPRGLAALFARRLLGASPA